MERRSDSCRPHVVAFPYPAQGHLTVMMHFALKLSEQGILVTFVTTQYRLKHMLQAAGEVESGSAAEIMEGIKLVGLDDGLPEDNPRDVGSIDCIRGVDSLGSQLEELLLQQGSLSPPVTCLVSDSFLPWTQAIANKCGVPRALFWPESLAVGSAYMCTSKLIAAGFDPCRRVKYRGERPSLGFIPGLPDMDPYDLPFNADTDFPDEESEGNKWFHSLVESQFYTLKDACWFIANTFEKLEGPIARALCSSCLVPATKLLMLGPLCNGALRPRQSVFRASLLKEDRDNCLRWLDTQPDASVLYISFGSIVIRTVDAINDVADALVACKQPFLWVLRSGWEDMRASLSKEFSEFAMKAGKLATWVPQLEVLSHRAVGGFFTHAGWNSTSESISKGVPMLAWPSFLDQFTNSWAISCLWKIGVQVMRREGSDMRGELERAIQALMQGPESREFRERAARLSEASSDSNDEHFGLFVNDMFKRASGTQQSGLQGNKMESDPHLACTST